MYRIQEYEDPKMTFEQIRNRLYTKKLYLTRKSRRKKINKDDFTLISNNCWGGAVYEAYDLPKGSPTVGLYFVAEEFIKFASNLKYYLEECEMTFVKPEEARHKAFYETEKKWGEYPIAHLDDVEIAMLHFHSEEEVVEKWKRRCERINYDRLIVKMNDQNQCAREHVLAFLNLPLENKLFFTGRADFADIEGVSLIGKGKKQCCTFSDEMIYTFTKLGIHEIINGLK